MTHLRAYLHFVPWILLVVCGGFFIHFLIKLGQLLNQAEEEHRDGL